MEGILLDPLQVKDSTGVTVDPSTLDMQVLIAELISRLDTLAACKHHLTEALRVQLVGSVALTASVSGTATVTDTTGAIYLSPAYAKFLPQVAMGNSTAVLSNINNVVIS